MYTGVEFQRAHAVDVSPTIFIQPRHVVKVEGLIVGTAEAPLILACITLIEGEPEVVTDTPTEANRKLAGRGA